MSNEAINNNDNPQPRVEAAFRLVSQQSMHNLDFLHPNMPVYVTPFQLFEQQWIGAVLTPWMLSLLILPGSGQQWQTREVGEKQGLIFPQGNITFTAGYLDGMGEYLASSLMSPLDKKLTPEQGKQLADDCVRMLLSLPVTNPDLPSSLSRRALFSRDRS